MYIPYKNFDSVVKLLKNSKSKETQIRKVRPEKLFDFGKFRQLQKFKQIPAKNTFQSTLY